MPDEFVSKQVFDMAHENLKDKMESIDEGIKGIYAKLDEATKSATIVKTKTEANEKAIDISVKALDTHKRAHFAFIAVVLAVLLIISIASGIVVSLSTKKSNNIEKVIVE